MSAIYVEYGQVTAVAGVVRGLGAAAIAFGLIVAGVPFPIIVALAALGGYAAGRMNPRRSPRSLIRPARSARL
jgi:hypothetical protein